jgi:hypothetical protein
MRAVSREGDEAISVYASQPDAALCRDSGPGERRRICHRHGDSLADLEIIWLAQRDPFLRHLPKERRDDEAD